jgi:hypothetical protein
MTRNFLGSAQLMLAQLWMIPREMNCIAGVTTHAANLVKVIQLTAM